MIKPRLLLVLITAAGIGGGVVRGLSLSEVFDRHTGLAEPNHPLTWTLIGIALLAAALSLLLKLDTEREPRGGANPLLMIACVILLASVLLDAIDIVTGNTTLTQIILAGLGTLSAVTLLLLAAAKKTEKLTMGLYATIPIFWASFWFLTLFASNSSDPVLLGYVFEFLAVLFTVAAGYTFAGFYFGTAKVRQLGIFIGLGVFFIVTSLLSPLVAWVYAPETSMLDGVSPAVMLRLLFSLLYLAAIPQLARSAMNITEEAQTNAEDKAV